MKVRRAKLEQRGIKGEDAKGEVTMQRFTHEAQGAKSGREDSPAKNEDSPAKNEDSPAKHEGRSA